MKCPKGSYAQLETVGKKLEALSHVKFKKSWSTFTDLPGPTSFGTFKSVEVRPVDFVGGGNVMVDGYAYQGKFGVACKAFLFIFNPESEFDNKRNVRFTFDGDEGFAMSAERDPFRENIEDSVMEAFDRLVVKLQQEANCLEAENSIEYPCTILAKQILAQTTELKKSHLLNYTISMHSAIKDAANRLRDPQYPDDREAMWTLAINDSPLNQGPTAIVCNMYGKYIDCLRAAVCFKQVHDLMFAIPHGIKLSDHIYLLPTATAYPKDFKPEVV